MKYRPRSSTAWTKTIVTIKKDKQLAKNSIWQLFVWARHENLLLPAFSIRDQDFGYGFWFVIMILWLIIPLSVITILWS